MIDQILYALAQVAVDTDFGGSLDGCHPVPAEERPGINYQRAHNRFPPRYRVFWTQSGRRCVKTFTATDDGLEAARWHQVWLEAVGLVKLRGEA